MIPEIGHYCLIMALCIALVQVVAPLYGVFVSSSPLINLAKSTAYGQLFFVALSFCILIYTLISNDFSVSYVAQNSNTHLPIIYRLSASWGAHEGSLLLWVLILNIWTALVATFCRQLPARFHAQVLAIMGIISLGFLLFLLTTSNPFQRLLPNVPLEGRDLNPLLQDPGLSLHPPILYMGYVGFAVVFSFAIASLLSGKFDSTFARLARPWTLLAWSFLTMGITLGSWWAYRVLGWGGWWFWDPVENASFLPWLSGTALIHSLIVAQKRDAFKAWTILLAVCTFSLSLMGTFLVRSGILVSVHAFAIDPARGEFILYFLAIVIGGSLTLYAWAGQKIENSGVFQFRSRETMLLTNNVILTSCMLTVLLGTLYPLMMDALNLGKLSVGPPYFNAVFLPFMVPLLFIMGIGPALRWKEDKLTLIIHRLKYTLPLCLLLALFLPLFFTGKVNLTIFIGLLLAFWVIIATLQNDLFSPVYTNSKRRWGMVLAHLGFVISVIGIIISTSYSIQKEVRMQPADKLSIGPYTVKFVTVSLQPGANYSAYQGLFIATEGKKAYRLHPELRIYNAQKMAIAKTAIKVSPLSDLYVALGEELKDGAWSMRIYYKPFVRWIWLGGLLMMAGGLMAAIRLVRMPQLTKSGG